MKQELVQITKLVNNKGQIEGLPKNPRFVKDHKFVQLKQSIKDDPEMLELREVIAVDYNGELVVIAGNMRLNACLELGIKEVPCKILPQNTPVEKLKAITIKDNIGYGEHDWDALANEWDVEELAHWGLDLPLDFEADETELEAEEDNYEVPEQIETDIVLGDLIEIGSHRIMCGDSTNDDHVAKLMNGEKADVAHNDPPYGMKKESDGVLNDNLNFDDLLQFNHDWIPLQFSYIKDNGSWYCWGIDEPLMDIYYDILRPYQKEQKLTFRNLITWDKGTGQGQNSTNTRMFAIADEKCLFVMFGKQNMVQNKDQFPEEWRPLLNYFNEERRKMNWSVQDCVTITGKTSASHYFTESQFALPTKEHYLKLQEASNGKAFCRDFDKISKQGNSILDEFYKSRAYFDNVHDNMNNVWHFARHKKDGSEGGHATPKPIPLCERAIKSSCPDGGLVLDFFLGSGSTMVASHQLKRKCYGMELDPKYCQVIIDRMKKLDPTLKIKKNGQPYEQSI